MIGQSNPQVATLMLCVNVLTTLLLPAIVCLICVAFFASPQQVADAARGEFGFSAMLGIFGAGPVWNWARDLASSGGGFGSDLAKYLWPLVVYRAGIAGLILPVYALAAYAAWRTGQSRAGDAFDRGEEPSPHRAKAAYVVLSWSLAAPALLAVLPWSIYAPVSIPIMMVALPISAYQLGRHLPFRV